MIAYVNVTRTANLSFTAVVHDDEGKGRVVFMNLDETSPEFGYDTKSPEVVEIAKTYVFRAIQQKIRVTERKEFDILCEA